MEEKEKFADIKESMEKIQEAMWISNEKKANIEEKEEKLHEETKIVVVEEQKEEIAKLKKEQVEYDEMTVNALINTKSDILNETKKSLENVNYAIRGRILDAANKLEEKGFNILKLNIGNPADYNLNAPSNILESMKNNLITSQGYSDSKGLKKKQYKYYQCFTTSLHYRLRKDRHLTRL